MSWSPLPPQRSNCATTRIKPPIAVSTTAGTGKHGPKLSLLLRPAMIEGVTWLTPGQGVQVLLGAGEHAGQLRIQKNGPHVVVNTPLCKPAGSMVGIRVPLPAGIPPAARAASQVEFDHNDGWIEVTLPSWADPLRPAAPAGVTVAPGAPPTPSLAAAIKGSVERGKQLAAEAAAMARARAAGAS